MTSKKNDDEQPTNKSNKTDNTYNDNMALKQSSHTPLTN